MARGDWYKNTDLCMYCGFPLGYDADAQVDAQDFKGGGSVYLMQRKPKRVAHGNCDFWATPKERKAAIKSPKPEQPIPARH